MSDPRRGLRERLQRIADAGSGSAWLEPTAKIVFGALVVAAAVVAIVAVVR